MNFVTQRLIAFSHAGGQKARVQYVAINDARYGNYEHEEGGNEEGIHRAWTPSQACPC